MLGRGAERLKTSALVAQFAQWREQHGGRGKRIPEDLWSAAVAVARVDGVDRTARALRLDQRLLARRLEHCSKPGQLVPVLPTRSGEQHRFVELDARALSAPAGPLVVRARLEGGDGEKLELELSGAGLAGVVELACAFWARRR